jgi:TRAP transporter 4TM/12TM fusion protein
VKTFHTLGKRVAYVRDLLPCVLILFPLLWLTVHVFRRYLVLDQVIVMELGLAMALVFWGTKNHPSLYGGWTEIAAGFIAIITTCWVALRFDSFVLGVSLPGTEIVFLSICLLVLALETTRRTAGMPMTLLVVTLVVFGYLAQFADGILSAPPTSLVTYITYLAIDGDALLGQALKVIVSIVVVFVLFGTLFEFSGGGEFIKKLALRFTASSRGAPIKISVLASGMLGSIVGSTTSNVLTVGSFTIPMMQKIGIPAHRAAAIEAVASTGGQLTPPIMGAAAFLMADLAELPYSQVILAALLPSLLYYFSLYIQADRLAARYGLQSLSLSGEVQDGKLLRDGLIFAIPVVAIIASLAAYEHAPYWAGIFGSIAIALVGLMRSVPPGKLLEAISRSGEIAIPVIITGATVGLIIGVVNATGTGVVLTMAVTSIASSNLLAGLILTAIAAYLVGMGLATTAVYVLVAILLAPTLIELGISVMAAHLFVFYSAMLSMITPPVAIACLIASGLANTSFIRTAIYAMKFGWIKYLLPFLFVYSPELIMEGTPASIVFVLFTISIGIVLMANASSGFERERLSFLVRILYALLAILLLIPWLSLEYRTALALLAMLWIARSRLLLLARSRFQSGTGA